MTNAQRFMLNRLRHHTILIVVATVVFIAVQGFVFLDKGVYFLLAGFLTSLIIDFSLQLYREAHR